MSRREFKPARRELIIPDSTSRLPTNHHVAVYYRQSTDGQVGNISTDMQTIDMVDYLKRRGWNENDIFMIDMDEGVSGTKKIEDRPGMRALFDLITNRKIRAVACQDEDRLFRDVTQIQVNIFIQACKDSCVLVITPTMVYDFAHEHLGTFHARQFRFKCEMAAEYINSVIIGKLTRAKERLMLQGRWAGAAVAHGYMVDTRKFLPNGAENPNWYKFAVFEPYAKVVRQYFQLFLDAGGNVSETLRRIRRDRISYPNPKTCLPPEGYAISYRLHQVGDGFYPSRVGLVGVLTNPIYIGHWCFHGAIVNWNNHPAIVTEQVFFQAFNYLSETSLNGEKNAAYRPIRQHARPTRDHERPVERPLCTGLMYGLINDQWKQVGTLYALKRQCYNYALVEYDDLTVRPLWERTAQWVDDAVSRLFHQKLRATFNAAAWETATKEFVRTLDQERKSKHTHLSTLKAAMENLIASIETLTHPRLIQEVEERYAAMEQEQTRLQAELQALANEHKQYATLYALQGTFEDAIARWDDMTRDEKHTLLQMFVDRIEAVKQKRYGGLTLTIYWRDASVDTLKVNKMPTRGYRWTQDNIDRLLALVDAKASQLEIGEAFPTQTWGQIRRQIDYHRGRVVFSPAYFGRDDTYEGFLARGGDKSSGRNTYHAWSQDEIQQLHSLVKREASQLEFMQAFPYRRWMYIRSKITQLVGSDHKVTLQKDVAIRDTYLDYQGRVSLNMGSVPYSP